MTQQQIFTQKFFILNKDMLVIQIQAHLKKQFKLNPEQAMFLFVNRKNLLEQSKELAQIY